MTKRTLWLTVAGRDGDIVERPYILGPFATERARTREARAEYARLEEWAESDAEAEEAGESRWGESSIYRLDVTDGVPSVAFEPVRAPRRPREAATVRP